MDKMDKKTKKRVGLVRERLQILRRQLAGAKRQRDDPPEVERLEKEVATAEAELQRLIDGSDS